MPRAETAEIEALTASFRADRGSAAILTDIDGTLAPIVERAEDAAIPAQALRALERLAGRYALVACVSGRRATAAREMVGLDSIAYSGNHGLELLLPGAGEPTLDETAAASRDAARDVLGELPPSLLESSGLRIEEKGPIQALHWRGAADEARAEETARAIAIEAEGEGLATHWGRKVLELRPPGGAGKDRAVRALLGVHTTTLAAYAGDDRTDLDAFRALREAVADGGLATALCVGVASSEGPEEIAAAADFVVAGPAGWLDILEALGS